MFVVSLSSKKYKKAIVLCGAVLLTAALAIFVFFRLSAHSEQEVASAPKGESAVNRLDFIESFGWVVEEEPIEIRQVAIPEEFDDVYENYNAIQIKQGYDLSEYAGRYAKRWTYCIKNYPEKEDSEYIRINILVCDGVIIGGDVCSVELDGFMHGFKKEDL